MAQREKFQRKSAGKFQIAKTPEMWTPEMKESPQCSVERGGVAKRAMETRVVVKT